MTTNPISSPAAVTVTALAVLLAVAPSARAQSPEPTASVEMPAGRWVVWAGASSFAAPAAPPASAPGAAALSGEFASPAAAADGPAAARGAAALNGEFAPAGTAGASPAAPVPARTTPPILPARGGEPPSTGGGSPFAPEPAAAPRGNATELYKLRDRQLNEAYQALSRRLTPADRERLKQSEREWIRGMEGLPTLEEKIRAIESRTLELQRMIVR